METGANKHDLDISHLKTILLLWINANHACVRNTRPSCLSIIDGGRVR